MAPHWRHRPTWRGYGLGIVGWALLVWATGIVQVWSTRPAVNGMRVRLHGGFAPVVLFLAVSTIVCVAGEVLWRARSSSVSNV